RCSKLLRRPISQTTVRAFFVVFDFPRRDLAPRIEQVLKPTHIQAFFPQPPVKAFYVRVLRWFSRLNVHYLDLPLDTPRQKMPTRQLRSIGTSDRQGLPALGHDSSQRSRHPSARATVGQFEGQAFSAV